MSDRTTADSPPAKLHVGFVMHVMQVAGAEVLVTQIIQQLADKIEATVFCLDDLGQLGQQLQDAGIPVVVLDRQPGLDWQVAKRLATEIRQRRVQLLHAHQYTPFFYSALARLRYRAAVKIVFTEHGRHYPDIVSSKRRWANRLCFQHFADVTTACCEFSTAALQKIEGFSKAVTLPNGVDLTKLPPRGDAEQQIALRRQLGLQPDLRYVACVARFHPVKDHATLIHAWREVHRRLPQARLLLIGDGSLRGASEQLVQTLDTQLAAAGEIQAGELTASIRFLGIRHDVPQLLRAVDIFTLTSVSEAASLTLLEAMASQCPAVVTAVGGNGEHVTDGQHGYLVPRGDHQQLADRLLELLQDPPRCRQMGAAARARVLADFDLRDVIEAYYRVYRTAVRGR